MNDLQTQPLIYEFPLSELPGGIEAAFRRIAQLPHSIFLDGRGDILTSILNRYSFLAADPIDSITVRQGDTFDFERLRNLHQQYQSTPQPDLPPFQGGVAGMLAYELNGHIESIAPAKIDDFSTPLLSLFVYDVVIALDHQLQTGWIVSHGWNQSHSDRAKRAKNRLERFQSLLFDDSVPFGSSKKEAITIQPGSTMHRVKEEVELYSDFSKDDFLSMIKTAVDYIHAGDIFQVNLSQRLLAPAQKPSPELYVDMRNHNPAPFSGYFDFGDGQLISASPERLVSCRDRKIETRPIKGTRRRTHYPEIDLSVQNELTTSEKDRAENIMIVDLMRNDLSRIANADSVAVEKLCGVEQYRNVLHLVSVVRAELADNHAAPDLLHSVFPGGSITGAPKIRAMEIISELEQTTRGPYCGSLGYMNFDGDLDFNILIRSVTSKGGWLQIPVGGGIVADSVPEKEYEETWTKAIGMLTAVVPTRKKSQPAQANQNLNRESLATE